MPMDRSFVALNHAATERMRALAERLSDAQLQHPVGQHWTDRKSTRLNSSHG